METKVFPELQERYLADPKSGPCPYFKAGDTFLLKRTPEQDDFYHLMNGKFCGEAWDAISRYVYTALQGGSISWRLVETDIVPIDKKYDLPLRDMDKKIQKDIDAGITSMDRDITLNYLIPLNLSLRKLADSTKENYKYMYERFIKDSNISEISIVDLKKTHILRFYKQQSENGLADGTIQMLHKIINPSIEMVVEDNLITKNPARGCCKDYNEKAHEKFAMTTGEQYLLLQFLKENHSKYRSDYLLLFRVMLGTACRIGEIMGLTWNHINLVERLIFIDHELLYRKRNGTFQFYASGTKTKSGKRIIPMTDDVYSCFTKLYSKKLSSQKSNADAVTTVIDGYSDFVFTSGNGNPLYPANINNALGKIVTRINNDDSLSASFPNISNHIFHHTACTRMAEAEMDPKTIQYIMGHGNLNMIMKTYDHISIERARNQICKMNVSALETGQIPI